MTSKGRLIAVVGVLLVALWDGSWSVQSAHAEEECLATPNAPPPQGTHWYYHLNRIKQSKCWYLRTEGQAIPKPVSQENPEASVVANVPRVAAPQADRDTGPEPQELRPIQAVPAALGQAEARAGPWPDPPSPAAADNVAWPDTPLPVTANSILEDKIPVTVANSGKDTRIGAGVKRWVTTTIAISGSPNEMPVTTMLLTFAVGLTISGMLVRRIARIGSARRRPIYVDRRGSDGTNSFVSEPGIPKAAAPPGLVSSRFDDSCLSEKVEETHRILAQVLGQQAA